MSSIMNHDTTLTQSEALMARSMIKHFIREDQIARKIGLGNRSAKYMRYAEVIRKLMNGRVKVCSFCEYRGRESGVDMCKSCCRLSDRPDNYKRMSTPKPKPKRKQGGYKLEV